MLISYFSFGQTVTGTITDDNNKPLPGATVVVKGTTRSTVSDNNGKYSIVDDSRGKLVISYAGFITQEIAVKDRKSIAVNMAWVSLKEMDAIVVTALGGIKPESF